MVAHVKGFRTFHADLRTENTCGSSVVGFERRACGRLWVTHLCEGSNNGDGLLGIEKETAGFGFRGRGSNTPKGFAENMDSTVGGGFRGIAGGSGEVGSAQPPLIAERTAAGGDNEGGVRAGDHRAALRRLHNLRRGHHDEPGRAAEGRAVSATAVEGM